MPAKKKSDGNNSGSQRPQQTKSTKTEKRKATSPLVDNTRDNTSNGIRVGSVNSASGELPSTLCSSSNKRVNNSSSPEQVVLPPQQLDMNTNAQSSNQNMSNYPHYSAYMQQMQQMQSPTFSGGIQPVPTPIPDWAITLMEDIKQIKSDVKRINEVEKTVNRVLMNVQSLEDRYKNMESKVADIDKSVDFISNEYEESKKLLEKTKTDMNSVKNRCDSLEAKLSSFELENTKLNKKIDDQESRSLRDNLLFYGVPEVNGEDCEKIVHELILHTLGIQDNIDIARAHRIGQKGNKGHRPIVAKFQHPKQRELVLTTAQSNRDVLQKFNKGVGIQQTKSVLEKRRAMKSIVDREVAAGRSVKWSGAKLLVRQGSSGPFREVSS